MPACAPNDLSKAILDLEHPIRDAEGAAAALVIVGETLSGDEQTSVTYLSDALARHVRDIRTQWRQLRDLTTAP